MHDVQQTIIGRGFCDTPSRTEHSLRLLLEIMHCARNLQISNLCKHLTNYSILCADFQNQL